MAVDGMEIDEVNKVEMLSNERGISILDEYRNKAEEQKKEIIEKT